MAKELSEEKILGSKFTLSLQTMIFLGSGLISLIGMWYALQADIQEAKELPKIGNIYNQEYPSRPEGYNWPRSYEQYKDQVGTLQDDMDNALDEMEEMKDLLKEIQNDIKDLERRKRDK